MKPSEIKVGKTYRGNKWEKTRRVVSIFERVKPSHHYVSETYVRFDELDQTVGLGLNDGCIRLSSFARWAKEEVEA